jgi:hypothetical protein
VAATTPAINTIPVTLESQPLIALARMAQSYRNHIMAGSANTRSNAGEYAGASRGVNAR